MSFDQRDFEELTREVADLMLQTADVPRLLKTRLGPEHELAKSAENMLGSLEALVREMRSFRGALEDHPGEAAES